MNHEDAKSSGERIASKIKADLNRLENDAERIGDEALTRHIRRIHIHLNEAAELAGAFFETGPVVFSGGGDKPPPGP